MKGLSEFNERNNTELFPQGHGIVAPTLLSMLPIG